MLVVLCRVLLETEVQLDHQALTVLQEREETLVSMEQRERRD